DLRIDRGSVLSDEDLDYRRYLITQNGVSPRSFPGEKGGIHVTSGDEHDESGNSEEKPEIRKEMMDKRFRKLEKLTREIPKPTIYGKRDASITLIGWGSTKGPVLETLRLFEEKDMDVNFLHFVYLNPFPKGISKILKSLNLLIGIEGNQTGQFSRLIREKTGKEMDHTILKYDGRPFIPSFILSEAEKVIRW
ncbi:MAG: 2-oxoacid:acceptor oxidoreductase subunit alpha, partial [Candidatus Methanofastidiosia archaeon]